MEIVGGSYREICIAPQWDRLWGSGGRAAAALSSISPEVRLHTYACKNWAYDIAANLSSFGVKLELTEIEEEVIFDYFHPMNKQGPRKEILEPYPSLEVSGDTVLSFGFVEGAAMVKGNYVVFDPQPNQREDIFSINFSSNNSSAENLAVIVSERDLPLGSDISDTMDDIIDRNGAQVGLLKLRSGAIQVFHGGTPLHLIPPYWSNTVFRIGTGDIFAAAFAHYWGVEKHDPGTAADEAARLMSYFADGHRVPLPYATSVRPNQVPILTSAPQVFVAGPVRTLKERWLMTEATGLLEQLGAKVFTPLYSVGSLSSTSEQNRRNALGLEDSQSLLAIGPQACNGGVVEIEQALKIGIPVVAFEDRPFNEIKNAMDDPRIECASDLVTAIYHSFWHGCRFASNRSVRSNG